MKSRSLFSSMQGFALTFLKILILKGFLFSTALAMPANPNLFIDQQPDGTDVSLRMKGDEHFHWIEDQAGYTVVHSKGWYNYARLNNQGRLVSTSNRVGHANPADVGLSKGILPHASIRAQSALTLPNAASSTTSGSGSTSAPQGVAPVGTIKNLVVMVRFSNHTGRTLPSTADMNVLFNGPGGTGTVAPTGSIKDVYLENSYGQMTLNSTISGWIDVSETEQYYANGNSGDSTLWQALREALDIIDQSVDFNQFDGDGDGFIDSITFIHSGYAAEWGGTDADGTGVNDRIWSHRWSIQPSWSSVEGVRVSSYHISPGLWGTSGSNIGRIGVIAHETGHFFGLPDLYDTDSGAGDGIGSYGLMANSWGFNFSQLCPPHFSPWSKIQLGWSTPTVINSDGEYTVREAESFADIYRIDQNFPSNEYLLIENRQNSGFDCSMPQGGLAIWHIDDTTGYNTQGYPGQIGWPTNGNHYRVALLQADGNYHIEKGNNRGDAGDVFRGGGVDSINPGSFGSHPNTDAYQNGTIIDTGHSIHSISASGSSMTFCLGTCSSILSPSSLTSTPVSVSEINLSWTDNSSDEDNFELERSSDGSSWSILVTLSANSNSYSDTGLSTGTTYFYRVRAKKATETSGFSNVTNATTLDVIPADPTGMSATATSSSEIALLWIDNANNENAYRLERSVDQSNWTVINLAANTITHNDTGLTASTQYFYRVFALNGVGDSLNAAQANATTDAPPAFIDYVATGETVFSGTVSGSYTATQSDGNGVQSITERDSGGNPQRRHDFLGHRWTFNVNAGVVVSLFANAWVSGGSEDAFIFEYSTDGSNYQSAFTVSGTSSANIKSAILPSGISGTVYVRVKDTDQTQGNRSHQTINVDHLYIRSENAVGGTVPDAPTGLSALADSSSQISLSWNDNSSDESGFSIERSPDGSSWAGIDMVSLNATSYTDTGLNSETTYHYRVSAFNATGDSAFTNSDSATTSVAAAIGLSANGFKVKGKHSVDLNWSGAAGSVDIIRNGNLVISISNSGAYTDNIGAKGGATYVYKVCEAGTSDCSDEVTVIF